ncbi:MAG: DUF4145 domain-containing protein [Solirubrobacteraceae bacterium]
MASERLIRAKQRERGERGEDIPPSNPDTPPDSSDPSGICPRCGRASNFALLGSLPVSFGGSYIQNRDGEMIPDAIDRVSSLRCSGCGQATAVIEEEWIGDHPAREGRSGGGTITWRGIHWWPPPGAADLDEAIPAGLRDSYAESMRALSARAPRAAAVMLRRTIEGLVKESGSETAQRAVKARLADGLQVMADEGALDRSLAQWAKEIRLTGNAGGHYDLMEDVDEAEAEDLARLTRQLLHYVYELPAKLRRART